MSLDRLVLSESFTPTLAPSSLCPAPVSSSMLCESHILGFRCQWAYAWTRVWVPDVINHYMRIPVSTIRNDGVRASARAERYAVAVVSLSHHF